MRAVATKTLSDRQLNRATLARQLLLERANVTPLRAVEALAGLQAQLPRPPYLGLWSRLQGFQNERLSKLLHQRKLVRATMMRCTLHLVSAKDYVALRPAIQPALNKAMRSALGKRANSLDLETLVQGAAEYFTDSPRQFNALRAHLAEAHPGGDERAMAYAIRTQLPLVQVPTDTTWGYPGTADFTPAATWLDTAIDTDVATPEGLVRRYLAAFGPATPGDAQTWSGLSGLRETFEAMRGKLVTFRDERGRELFDLPKAPRPAANTSAPVRFLPDYDNLVLAHDDRRRLIDDAHRPKVCLKNLRILPTFLIDGRVAGTWAIEAKKRRAVLRISAFDSVSAKSKAALKIEGEALCRFVEKDAQSVEITFG